MPDMLKPPAMRDFLDYDTTRKRMYEGVPQVLSQRFPMENEKFRLELSDLKYDGPETFSLADQKKAILQRTTLSRPLKGKWTLVDKTTNTPLDTYKSTVADIPYLTQRGTYIVRGNEFTVANQMRLKSGVYSRKKDNGEYEAHFNVLKGGPGFRVFMEPETGVFRMQVGQARLRLYPILQAAGVKDADIRKQWGNDLFSANVREGDGQNTLGKLWDRLSDKRMRAALGDTNQPKDFRALLEKLELDPGVTQRTLGQAFANAGPDTLMRTTAKLINIAKGTEDVDDRDSLAYQETWSADDLLKDRILKDAGRLAARHLWRATLRKDLSGMPAAALTPQVESLFYKSGVAQPLEEVNPLDNVDQNLRLTRLGEGGISNQDSIPVDSRQVQPSHMGFIDPVRSPESSNIGVDLRVASGVQKGDDRRLYMRVMNVKTGKTETLGPEKAVDTVIAFPGEIARAQKEGRTHVRAMSGSKMRYVSISAVDYEVPTAQDLFSYGANLVPMTGQMKAGRLLMASKMTQQALPLQQSEAPYVQSGDAQGGSYYQAAGKHVGAVFADGMGQVTAITPDQITLKMQDGSEKNYELYSHFPLNRKTMLTNTPQVAVGDVVQPGQIMARSNFTDNKGTLAIGKNLRTAYIPMKGNYEDAMVISESASKKMTSEHMFTEKVDTDDFTHIDRNKFLSIFPAKYNRAQLDTIDEKGIVRPGTILKKDDPMILSTQQRTSRGAGMISRGAGSSWSDASRTWEHDFPGEVTDSWSDKDGVKVAVRAYAPAEVGDKFSARFGNKGVVGRIVPDHEMPVDETGNPIEVALNPTGIITRGNPSAMYETVLGKIAAKTGRPYVIPPFPSYDMTEFVLGEMAKNGVKDKEDLIDPLTNRKIPGILTGQMYMMKLHHTSESKSSGRALGAYTSEGTPSLGDPEDDNPKRVGLGEMQALISHGVPAVIRDIKNLRGTRNDDYWRAITLGYTPPSPDMPAAYKKFMALMQASGINPKKEGNYIHLTSMTDKDVEAMSAGEITDPTTVRWSAEFGRGAFGEKSLEPVEGGLFDRGLTGGHGGNRWSHLSMAEPVPQPAMEDPIRRLLGLTTKEYEDVIAGRKNLQGIGTGGTAIKTALSKLDVTKELAYNEDIMRTADDGNTRDAAIKKLGYLRAMAKSGMNPGDLVVTKVPVLPPIFRPITANNKFEMVSGSNLLYMDLMHASKNLKALTGQIEGEPLAQARLAQYNALKAVTGLGDPIKPERVQMGVHGLLKEIFGSSPKAGTFQRKLLGTSVDLAARAVITPNSELDMDHIGLPVDQAWKLYSPFVVRRLIRQMGDKPEARATAVRMVVNKDPRAFAELQKEMEARPVLTSRAPALHRYSIMAFKPVLVNGKSLQLSPAVTPGFNADFDGDAMNFHVVAGADAVAEAFKKMLPSANLRGLQDFGPQWMPRHEFLQGLYTATTKRNGKRMLPVYNNARDVVSGFKRGELNVDDVVSVKD